MPLHSKSILKIFRIVITLLLIYWVVWKTGLFQPAGRRSLLELVAGIRLPFLVASLGIGVALNLASALKWKMLLKSQRILVSLWRLFAYYVIGQFYNLILPTSMGGDLIRMHTLARYCQDGYAAIASVFVERFTGMVTLVVLSAFAVLVNLKTFNMPLVTISLLAVALLIAVIGWLVLDARPFRFFRRHLMERVSFLQRVGNKIEQFQDAVAAYRNSPGALGWAFLNSLLFYFLAIVNVYVTAKAFTDDIQFLPMVIATPVIMLIMNLPVSIGGLGLMEFAYVFTFELMGFGPALGLSTGLLMRLKTLLDGVLGGTLQLVVETSHADSPMPAMGGLKGLDIQSKKE